jgi:hypothetical protein
MFLIAIITLTAVCLTRGDRLPASHFESFLLDVAAGHPAATVAPIVHSQQPVKWSNCAPNQKSHLTLDKLVKKNTNRFSVAFFGVVPTLIYYFLKQKTVRPDPPQRGRMVAVGVEATLGLLVSFIASLFTPHFFHCLLIFKAIFSDSLFLFLKIYIYFVQISFRNYFLLPLRCCHTKADTFFDEQSLHNHFSFLFFV